MRSDSYQGICMDSTLQLVFFGGGRVSCGPLPRHHYRLQGPPQSELARRANNITSIAEDQLVIYYEDNENYE